MVKEKEQEAKDKQDRAVRPTRKAEQKKPEPSEQQALAQFEKVITWARHKIQRYKWNVKCIHF